MSGVDSPGGAGTWVRRLVWANVLVTVVSLACHLSGFPDLLRAWMPLSFSGFWDGAWWQPMTYLWIHAQFEGPGVLHLVCNMMTLVPFGRAVEYVLGARAFWGIYLTGGVFGACGFLLEMGIRVASGHLPVEGDPGLVGASAAVLAVVTAFALLFPEARIGILFLPFRMRASRFLLVFAGVSLFLIFSPYLGFIAHSAHLGGMVGGWLYCRIFLKEYLYKS